MQAEFCDWKNILSSIKDYILKSKSIYRFPQK